MESLIVPLVHGCVIPGRDAFDQWRSGVQARESPKYLGHSLPKPELAAGQITLLGGAAGVGKTALVMNTAIDVLRHKADATALACNVEMPIGALLDRQLARLSGLDAEVIHRRSHGEEHEEAIARASATLEDLVDRLFFVDGRASMEEIRAAVEQHRPDLVVLDYLQRLAAAEGGNDIRGSVNRAMAMARGMADRASAVCIVSALNRPLQRQGQATSLEPTQASFRESSEIEFGADNAYILWEKPSKGVGNGCRLLQLCHLKSRYGRPESIDLVFDPAGQTFSLPGDNS